MALFNQAYVAFECRYIHISQCLGTQWMGLTAGALGLGLDKGYVTHTMLDELSAGLMITTSRLAVYLALIACPAAVVWWLFLTCPSHPYREQSCSLAMLNRASVCARSLTDSQKLELVGLLGHGCAKGVRGGECAVNSAYFLICTLAGEIEQMPCLYRQALEAVLSEER